LTRRAEDVSQLYLRGVLNGRPIIVQPTSAPRSPVPTLIKQAQIGLNPARLVPAPAADSEPTLRDPMAFRRLSGLVTRKRRRSSSRHTADPRPLLHAKRRAELGADDAAIHARRRGALQDLRCRESTGRRQIGRDLCVGARCSTAAARRRTLRCTTTPSRLGAGHSISTSSSLRPDRTELPTFNGSFERLQFSPIQPRASAPGGTAVGFPVDGAKPACRPTMRTGTLTWSYAHGRSLSVPEGVDGVSYSCRISDRSTSTRSGVDVPRAVLRSADGAPAAPADGRSSGSIATSRRADRCQRFVARRSRSSATEPAPHRRTARGSPVQSFAGP